MIPIFSHFHKNLGHKIWVTTDGRMGITVEVSAIDAEQEDLSLKARELSGWMQRLDPKVSARVISKVEDSTEPIEIPRSRAFHHFGFTKFKYYLSLEIAGEPLFITELKSRLFPSQSLQYPQVEILDQALSSLADSGLQYQQLSQEQVQKLFPENPKMWVVNGTYLEHGKGFRACVRISRPHSQEIEFLTLEKVLRQLPKPYEVQTSFQRLSGAETMIYLQKRIRQSVSETDRAGHLRLVANEDALEKTLLDGDSLFRTEFIVSLDRGDVRELKQGLSEIETALSAFGEPLIETFGILPSLSATYVGSPQHVTFLETGKNLSAYLPVFREGQCAHPVVVPSSFSIHRNDQSVSHVNILGREHLNANAVIVGASGRGKSGLVGTLTSCLLMDPNVSILKVDVGGSHSRECALHGGAEYRLSLTSPSGLNPFRMVAEGQCDEGVRAILVNFLSVLILEDGETHLPKKMKVEIDDYLKSYFVSKPKTPSLDDFYEMAKEFPRRELLSRFVNGGLYSQCFRSECLQQGLSEIRLRYLNFSSIFEAADQDFAQAGMAAVLAQFNLEMRANPNRRLVLICDETPFFIRKCFEFFKFSTANVRKFGASVVLVVQMSSDLIVNGDHGIIGNSHHRFLMSADGDKMEYRSRFHLSERQLEIVLGLQSIPRKFSEFLYQCGEKGFKARLKLTPEEYWKITTTLSEKAKIEGLLSAVPDLTLEEAVTCLALRW